jgi:benzodiazapine receptor
LKWDTVNAMSDLIGKTSHRDNMRSALALAGFLALTFTAASPGALFLPGDWYAALNKQTWNPPNWIFGPVWTTLYAIMAVAAWLVWRRGGFLRQRTPLTLFLLQLFLNAIWSPLCFGAKNLGWALVDIVLLWIALTATLIAFGKTVWPAGALLAPYLAWVTFAAALNFALWRLNP